MWAIWIVTFKTITSLALAHTLIQKNFAEIVCEDITATIAKKFQWILF